MTQFLANVLEQMDLALDQLAVNDANYKRFTLMLVDNVVELTLHQYASDKSSANERWGPLLKPKYPPKLVAAAMGQNFDDKAKLAAETGLISKIVKDTIVILHSFRNEVYHRGIAHENILPAISLFYFQNACDILGQYKPSVYSWGTRNSIPHRAKKYLGANPFMKLPELFSLACKRLHEVSEGLELNLPKTLADHVESMVEEADHNIQFLADDGPNQMTREQVIVDSQTWDFAFTEKAKAFARENKCNAKTIEAYVQWIKDNYDWKDRRDTIPSWKRRLNSLQRETDPHKALLLYKNFMDQTEVMRNILSKSAVQLDQHIQGQIDIARGK
jgi:hypothetical protein